MGRADGLNLCACEGEASDIETTRQRTSRCFYNQVDQPGRGIMLSIAGYALEQARDRVNLHSFGDRRNPPLVLLHGIGAGHRLWLRQIEYFRKSHFVIAPDLPDFTGPAIADAPDIAAIARRLAAELNEHSLGPVALCGISAGASVALAMAARMGSGVDRLILSAPQVRAPRFMLGLQITVSALMPEAALIAIASRAAQADPEIAAATAEDMKALGKGGLLAAMRALRRMDLRAELPAITAPAWVFCGERDRVNLPAARSIAAALPDARLWIAPGAGHLWNVDSSARFNEALGHALGAPLKP